MGNETIGDVQFGYEITSSSGGLDFRTDNLTVSGGDSPRLRAARTGAPVRAASCCPAAPGRHNAVQGPGREFRRGVRRDYVFGDHRGARPRDTVRPPRVRGRAPGQACPAPSAPPEETEESRP